GCAPGSGGSARAWPACSTASGWPRSATPRSGSCRWDTSAWSRWPAPWRCPPGTCCWTSPPPVWARASSACSPTNCAAWPPRGSGSSSWSTTSTSCWTCATASWCCPAAGCCSTTAPGRSRRTSACAASTSATPPTRTRRSPRHEQPVVSFPHRRVRSARRLPLHRPARRGGGVPGPPRPQRRGQEHPAARPGRPEPEVGRGRAGRAQPHRAVGGPPGPRRPRLRPRVQGQRLRVDDRRGEHGHRRTADPQRRRAGRRELTSSLFPVLDRYAAKPAGLLSGGEQQMLAISMAPLADPAAVLLDEPSQGLAPSVLRAIGEALTQLRSTGITILLAEQTTRFAPALADRVVRIEQGRLTDRPAEHPQPGTAVAEAGR